MIAHLKDQLQEMKAKTSMEGKYIKKDAEVLLKWAEVIMGCVYPSTKCSCRIRNEISKTAHLPLPQANLNIYFSLRANCWLRGGVVQIVVILQAYY